MLRELFRWAQSCHFYNYWLRILLLSCHWSVSWDNLVWTGACSLRTSSSSSLGWGRQCHCPWSSWSRWYHLSCRLPPGTFRRMVGDTERSQAEIISSSSSGPCPSPWRPPSRSSPWGRPPPSCSPSSPPAAPWWWGPGRAWEPAHLLLPWYWGAEESPACKWHMRHGAGQCEEWPVSVGCEGPVHVGVSQQPAVSTALLHSTGYPVNCIS